MHQIYVFHKLSLNILPDIHRVLLQKIAICVQLFQSLVGFVLPIQVSLTRK